MKPKSNDQQIRECLKKVSEEDIKFLSGRLSQRLGGDLGEALTLVQDRYPELNKILSSAMKSVELYDLIDTLDRQIQEVTNKKMPLVK